MHNGLGRVSIVAGVGLTLFLITSHGSGQPASSPLSPTLRQLPRHVEGEVLVKFRANARTTEKNRIHGEADVEILTRIPKLRVERVKTRRGESTEALLERYRRNPLVEYVEPNGLFSGDLTPTDPRFVDQYGLHNTGQSGGIVDADIDAPEAWDIQTGSPGVIVANIDSGVDLGHEDLWATRWTNAGEVAGNGIDDDGNGYIDDVWGWDFANNDEFPLDDNGHGTHTQGTIAAMGNNGIGVAGVAWQVKAMALKVLNASNVGTWDAAAAAIIYAADNGARIANASWGADYGYTQTVEDAIAYARSRGMMLVASAGNDGYDNDVVKHYPCSSTQPNVVCVAATDRFDEKAIFPSLGSGKASNYGATTVDIGAPGRDIWSTFPGGYGLNSGTSMAAPHVTGTIALLLSQNASLTLDQLKAIVAYNADPVTALAGRTLTGGRVNAGRALQNMLSTVPDLVTTEVSGPSTGQTGGNIAVSTTVRNQGVGSSTGVSVRLFLSLDQGSAPDVSDILIGERWVSGLGGGVNSTEVMTGSIPSSAPPGNYFLIATADSENLVMEADEANNGFTGNAISITAGPGVPDLLVTTVSGPTSASAGTNISIVNTVFNQGDGASGGFFVSLYLSQDQIITASDTWLGVRWVGVLGSGATSGGNNTVALPSGVASGTYYLGAIADSEAYVAESNEGNNASAGNTIAIGPAPTSYLLTVTKAGLGSGTVTSNPAGLACGVTCAVSFYGGTVVNLTASAVGGATFGGWSGACTGTEPCSVTMSAAQTVTARFDSPTSAGLVAWYAMEDGASGSVPATITDSSGNNNHGTNSGATLVAGQAGFGNALSLNGSTNTVSIPTNAGLQISNGTIAGWIKTSNAGTSYRGIVVKPVAYGMFLNSNVFGIYDWGTSVFRSSGQNLADGTWHHVAATFQSGTSNGTVLYIDGSAVTTTTMTVSSQTNNVRLGSNASGSNVIQRFAGAIDQAKIYNRVLAPSEVCAEAGRTWTGSTCITGGTSAYTLTVSKAGTGTGTATSSPAGISCGTVCSADYSSGTVVTLSAVPDSGSTFGGWSGAGCSGTGTCVVTMGAAQSVTATFTLQNYSLTVNRSGTGSGTVTSSPSGINCGAACTASYPSGTVVTLTAAPDSGSTFGGWSGAGCSGTGTCVVTMGAAQSVTATFTLQNYSLTVNRSGTGSGAVTSSPSGINCGAACTASYPGGTVVTLTAAPDSGSTFGGWSGAGCSGTGTCAVTMNTTQTVTATFSPSGSGGPVAWYAMEDGAIGSVPATLADSSGNGNIGSNSGATLVSSQSGMGNALSFNGSTNTVSIPTNTGLQVSAGTITAWIKTSNAGSSYRGIVVKPFAYGMFLNGNVFGIYDWGASTFRTSGQNLADGAWHHVAATFQSGVTNGTVLYLDGNAITTTKMTVSSQTSNLRLGSNASGSTIMQHFAGVIDQAKIFSRVLAASEVCTEAGRTWNGTACVNP